MIPVECGWDVHPLFEDVQLIRKLRAKLPRTNAATTYLGRALALLIKEEGGAGRCLMFAGYWEKEDAAGRAVDPKWRLSYWLACAPERVTETEESLPVLVAMALILWKFWE